jgi:hypothetical protein
MRKWAGSLLILPINIFLYAITKKTADIWSAILTALFSPLTHSEKFDILELYSHPAFLNNHIPNPHSTAPPLVIVSSSASADQDALLSPN